MQVLNCETSWELVDHFYWHLDKKNQSRRFCSASLSSPFLRHTACVWWTDRRTDTSFHRDARTHLKNWYAITDQAHFSCSLSCQSSDLPGTVSAADAKTSKNPKPNSFEIIFDLKTRFCRKKKFHFWMVWGEWSLLLFVYIMATCNEKKFWWRVLTVLRREQNARFVQERSVSL